VQIDESSCKRKIVSYRGLFQRVSKQRGFSSAGKDKPRPERKNREKKKPDQWKGGETPWQFSEKSISK
jgi:hypothetical protein